MPSMLSIQIIAAVLAMLLALKASSFKALPCAVQSEMQREPKQRESTEAFPSDAGTLLTMRTLHIPAPVLVILLALSASSSFAAGKRHEH